MKGPIIVLAAGALTYTFLWVCDRLQRWADNHGLGIPDLRSEDMGGKSSREEAHRGQTRAENQTHLSSTASIEPWDT